MLSESPITWLVIIEVKFLLFLESIYWPTDVSMFNVSSRDIEIRRR